MPPFTSKKTFSIRIYRFSSNARLKFSCSIHFLHDEKCEISTISEDHIEINYVKFTKKIDDAEDSGEVSSNEEIDTTSGEFEMCHHSPEVKNSNTDLESQFSFDSFHFDLFKKLSLLLPESN